MLAVFGAKMWWQNRDVAYAQPTATVVTFGDKLVATADGAVLDLEQIQPGDWETVHIVGPYTTPEALQQRLEIERGIFRFVEAVTHDRRAAADLQQEAQRL